MEWNELQLRARRKPLDFRFPHVLFSHITLAHIVTHIKVNKHFDSLKEGRNKFTLWRFRRVLLTELHADLVESTFPIGPFFSGNPSFPGHEVHGSIGVADGPGVESEWMVSSPVLSFFL